MRDENEKGHFKERMCTKAQSFGIHTLFPNVGILGNPIRSVYLEPMSRDEVLDFQVFPSRAETLSQPREKG